jgi:hypothetical protein
VQIVHNAADPAPAAVFHLRTWEKFPQIEELVKVAEDLLHHGPIWGVLEDGLTCCKELEALCTKNKKELFETESSRTSILNKRTPLLLGGDVNTKGPTYGVQNTEKWKVAAQKLLNCQNALLNKTMGAGWIIPDMFDFGSQLLLALKDRQRTHADSLTLTVSMVTFLSVGASKTSFANGVFNFREWQDKMLSELDKNRTEELSEKIIGLVNELKTGLETQDTACPEPQTAKQSETAIFDGRHLHWGPGSDKDRFVVYSEAMPQLLFDNFFNKIISGVTLRKTLLTTYYSTEMVIDRRTIANPAFLYNLFMFKSREMIQWTSAEEWATMSDSFWDYLSTLADKKGLWPSAVCECCSNNRAGSPLVKCTVPGCLVGSIHETCMTTGAKKKPRGNWKCFVCLAGK